MKADAVLSRLLALRRLREQRALETLVASEAERRRAEEAVEQADDEAARQLAGAKAHERREIKSLVGRPVSEGTIRRFRDSIDVLMAEQQRLRELGEAARQALHERQDALREAQADYGRRHRAVAKLDQMAKQQSERTTARESALDEAANEERTFNQPRLPTGGN